MALDEFRKTLIYDVQAPVDAVVADIAELRAIDLEHEVIERRWKWLGILSILAAVPLGCGGIFVADSGGPAPFVFGAAGLALVFAIVSFIQKKRYGRFNYENRRYELVERVVKLLGADMHPEAQVAVTMDLRDTDHKSKFERKGKVRDWKVNYYRDPWLKVRGKLLDGTAFALSAIEKLQHRSKWKTNARGKTKHKSKTKCAAEMIVQLKPKGEKYARLGEIAADAAGAIQIPAQAELKSVNVEEQMLTLRATCQSWACEPEGSKPTGLSGHHLLAMMMLSLYQVLNLSKVGKK